jgi:phosphorylase kinase alpha/beta subunit
MSIAKNQGLGNLIQPKYTLQDIHQIESFLENKGTFSFPALENGLFSAALLGKEGEYTGYTNIWVQDNIHIAHAHYIVGKSGVAVKNINTLMTYFKKHQERFEKIITGEADAQEPMNRPYIRFNGHHLEELQEKWAHAQNDALGYFLWFYCRLANHKLVVPQQEEMKMLALFVLYFQTIRYWEDEDSGHWEEVRKISASSMGIVVAALKELRRLINQTPLASDCGYRDKLVTDELLTKLIEKGTTVLESILPAECIQSNPEKQRRYDAALLFLIYPLQVVEKEIADRILQDVINNLQGEYGIRRYLGDSYWAPDYKKKLRAESRTVDFSGNMLSRDALLPKEGLEAQWCIFDPIVSVIFGKRFQETRQKEDLIEQVKYLNRSLGQITGKTDQVPAFRCPEMYYLEEGRYVPNDHVPLLWTQANLIVAIKEMGNSLSY